MESEPQHDSAVEGNSIGTQNNVSGVQNNVSGVQNIVSGDQYNAQDDITVVKGNQYVVTAPIIVVAGLTLVLLVGLALIFFNGSPAKSGALAAATPTTSCPPLNGAMLNSVVMTSANDGWAVGEGGVILHYTHSCWQQRPIPIPSLRNLHSVSLAQTSSGWVGYAVGDGKTVLKYKDGDWQTVGFPPGADLTEVQVVSDNSVWIEGNYNGSTINTTTGAGFILNYADSNPTPVADPESISLHGLFMATPNHGWVGSDNNIKSYQDGKLITETISNIPVSDTISPNSISMAPDGKSGWAVGGLGTIVGYKDGVWSEYGKNPITDGSSLNSVYVVSPTSAWAVGMGGHILHYDGKDWFEDKKCQPASSDLNSVYMVSDQLGWAVGSGVILYYQGGKWHNYGDPKEVCQ